MSYTIYTDASFDDITKTGAYAIIIMQENIVIKTIAKKCRIQVNNSTECEIFAIYQAINVILSSYIKKDKMQKFKIKTDCIAAKDFFAEKKNKINVFRNEKELSATMKKLYNKLQTKLSKKGCSFTLKWFSRDNNKIAHKYSYSLFQKIKVISNHKEFLIINKKSFLEIISKYNQFQCELLCYLIKIANEQKIIEKTQREIAEALNISNTLVNKNIKELITLNILEKIKNGKYALGI